MVVLRPPQHRPCTTPISSLPLPPLTLPSVCRELVDLPDGGVVALDWHRASFKGAKKDDPHPIVLLVPGLTGEPVVQSRGGGGTVFTGW